MEIKYRGFATAKQIRDIKQYTGKAELTKDEFRKFIKTNDDILYPYHYYSEYDLELKKAQYDMRVAKYGQGYVETMKSARQRCAQDKAENTWKQGSSHSGDIVLTGTLTSDETSSNRERVSLEELQERMRENFLENMDGLK